MVGMDPMIPTAVTMLANGMSFLKNASDLAKTSTDTDLKIAISDAYSALIDLKAKLSEIDDENRELKAKLRQKESVKRTSEFGYYFKDGDSDPLCPKCYERDGKLIHLSEQRSIRSEIWRDCEVCQYSKCERAATEPFSQAPVKRRRNNWMGN